MLNNLDIFNDNLNTKENERYTEIDQEELKYENDNEDLLLPGLKERKLYTDKSDRSLADLNRMVTEGELNLQPDFQRKYIWNKKQASKFIESLLLGIPVPMIFLSENYDSTFEVIDGQQRLTSLNLFFNDEIKLTGLETLSEYNNLKFSELDDKIKRLLKSSRTMPVVSISSDSSEDVKFDVFQRINEGAIKLNSQELRNVVYRGELIDWLINISNISDYKSLFGDYTIKRQLHEEFILRMVSINALVKKNNGILKLSDSYNGRINSVMVEFLVKYRNDKEFICKLNEEFNSVYFEGVYKIFEDSSFKLPKLEHGSYIPSNVLNRTFAEFLYILFSNLPTNLLHSLNKETIKNVIYKEISEDNKIILFQRATGNTTNLKARISLINNIIIKLNSGDY